MEIFAASLLSSYYILGKPLKSIRDVIESLLKITARAQVLVTLVDPINPYNSVSLIPVWTSQNIDNGQTVRKIGEVSGIKFSEICR